MKLRTFGFGLGAAVTGLLYFVLLGSLDPLLSLGWTFQGVFLVTALTLVLGVPSGIMSLKALRSVAAPRSARHPREPRPDGPGPIYRALSSVDEGLHEFFDNRPFVALVSLMLLAALVLPFWPSVAAEGDILRVSYVGVVQSNGTVFDVPTDGSHGSFKGLSLSEVDVSDAGSAWVYAGDPWRYDASVYHEEAPTITVTVAGFHRALDQKVVGQLYTEVTVPPRQAYGSVDPEKINVVPRFVHDEPRRLESVSLETLFSNSDAGHSVAANETIAWKIYNGSSLPARVTGVNQTSETADLYLLPTEGQRVQLDVFPATIVNVTDTTYDLRRDPEIGERYDDGRVSEVNSSIIRIDGNHPLAGEVLTYSFRIHGVWSPPQPKPEPEPDTGPDPDPDPVREPDSEPEPDADGTEGIDDTDDSSTGDDSQGTDEGASDYCPDTVDEDAPAEICIDSYAFNPEDCARRDHVSAAYSIPFSVTFTNYGGETAHKVTVDNDFSAYDEGDDYEDQGQRVTGELDRLTPGETVTWDSYFDELHECGASDRVVSAPVITAPGIDGYRHDGFGVKYSCDSEWSACNKIEERHL